MQVPFWYPQQCLGPGDNVYVEIKVIAFEYEGQKFDQSLCRWILDFSFLPNFFACLDAILMGNIGIEGSDIHGNKEGVGWKWALGILLPQEICCVL